MSSKNQHLTCLVFTETQLQAGIFNLADNSVIQRLVLPLPPQSIKSNGAFVSPAQIHQYLESIYHEHQFPSKTVIGIPLKYLDLKRLSLPDLPEEELKQIIIDEATRESIFSLSGDPVAVAYRIQGTHRDSGRMVAEIMAATVPQEVVESYRNAFASGTGQLLSIKPLFEGLREAIRRQSGGFDPVAAFVKPAQDEAEFYIWQNGGFAFWRPLMVGLSQPERLQAEINNSLEHFQRRATRDYAIDTVYMISKPFPLQLPVKVEFVRPDLGDDWAGLIQPVKGSGFDFYHQKTAFSRTSGFMPISLIPGLLVLLLAANIGLTLTVLQTWPEVKQIRNRLEQKQALLTTARSQIENPAKDKTPASRLNIELFLDGLRKAVPADLRFERLEYTAEAQGLQLEGYCLAQESLNYFIKRLPHVDPIRSVAAVQAERAELSGNEVIRFKLNLHMEVGNGIR